MSTAITSPGCSGRALPVDSASSPIREASELVTRMAPTLAGGS